MAAEDFLLCATAILHVLLAPYTKVEESFNLHATHDVLMYGVRPEALKHYDHFIYPGVVPRSFVGSVLLAWLSTPVIRIAQHLNLLSSKMDIQLIVRLILALINASGLILLRRASSRAFGRQTGRWFTFLTCSQFHLPYWMGRTLPNMFALFPLNLAMSFIVDPPRSRNKNGLKPALGVITATACIFRAEIVLFLGPLALQALFNRKISFISLAITGFLSALVAIGITVAIDSYFWNQFPLWPELSGIYFNVYEGKSAEWGVSPPHTYVTAFLPKLLLGALPLAVLGVAVDRRIARLTLPAAAFIALISGLGHKEWRFIIYVVPLANIAAARPAALLWSLRTRLSLFVRLGLIGVLVINVAATALLTHISQNNYPGGIALRELHSHTNIANARVWIDNLAAQTGASLFSQLNSPPYVYFEGPKVGWTYDKTPRLDLVGSNITHAVVEKEDIEGPWRVLHVVRGVSGIKRRKTGGLPFEVGRKDMLWIVETDGEK